MSMSSIGAPSPRLYPQSPNSTAVAGTGFAQSLAVAAGPDAGTRASSGATSGTGTSVADPTPDFTNMTPHQLYATAQTMYNQGKIGLDELFNMQMMSGEFQTNGVSTGSETPVDYVQAFKDTRAFNATHGGWGANGYDPYTAILNAIGAGGQSGQNRSA